MKSLLLLIVALTWLAIFSNSVLACQCVDYDVPVCSAYWTTSTVFVGQLRDITLPDSKSTDPWAMATLHFIVEQPFRGVKSATVDVETGYGSMCDYKFVKGTRYLVYADEIAESHKLYTGFCDRTMELVNAGDDLSYISSVIQGSATESIVGMLVHWKYTPVAGVKIEVRNDDKTIDATTDEDGKFSISPNGPGTYTVRVVVPAPVLAMPINGEPIKPIETTDVRTVFEYQVKLDRSECNYRKFNVVPIDLHATAELSGVVLTATGRAVNKGFVHLIDAKNADQSTFNKIEVDGSFKFEEVPVGEYILAVNPDNKAPGSDDPPYAAAFYPNATAVSKATKIVVTEGAKLENLILRVGPALKARKVSGRVVWEDGGPVTNAHLSLYNGKEYVRLIDVDKEGRFEVTLYGDFPYRIHAEAFGKPHGRSDDVEISDKSTKLKLTLRPQ